MFHVEPSTILDASLRSDSDAMFHVEHGASEQRALGRQPVLVAGKVAGQGVAAAGPGRPATAATRAPTAGRARPGDAAGQRSRRRRGGSLTTRTPPTRRSGAAHSAVAAGEPKLPGDHGVRVSRERDSMPDAPRRDPRPPRRAQVEAAGRPLQGTGSARWPEARAGRG